jgi:hypothetical protein
MERQKRHYIYTNVRGSEAQQGKCMYGHNEETERKKKRDECMYVLWNV